MTLGLLVATTAIGCKGVEKGRKTNRTVKASIQAFDPNADIGFDFGDGGGGGETPDDYMVQQAFQTTFGGLDECVAAYKGRKGMSADKQLDGEISISVKLNPANQAPLGINASITNNKFDKDEELKTCLKQAVEKAPFPTYDGAPRIVDFSTELDAGSEFVES